MKIDVHVWKMEVTERECQMIQRALYALQTEEMVELADQFAKRGEEDEA